MTEPDGWRRLHPLSPVVRGGRATIAIAVILLPSVFGARRSSNTAIELGAVAVIVGLGFVSWLVTRWRVDGDDLRIETGLIRRQSLRFPLSQVQAIDVIRPGLARIFRVAELRLRMGGATGKTARLAYLHEREVEPLRDRLLALARGTPHVDEAQELRRDERVLAPVPTGRLVGSILISDVGILAEAVLVGLVLGIVLAPSAAAGIASGGAVWILSVFQLVWRRFNQEYRLTVVEIDDGLVLRGGLVGLTAETIRPGRVQAVRMVEPIAWRALGWCRLEVDLAGRQRAEGEGRAQRRSLRAVLPVGSRAVAEELLDHLLPDRPREQTRPPRRAVWKSPLRYRMLAWGRTPTCVATTSGRLRRATNWVALEKAQSLRRVQGPLQRRLRLASVHVDTAGRNVHAVIRDRDVEEANNALVELVASAESARHAA
ncbi:MAG TPA: PH domain-containing protein [Gaiellaceae bacterium]|jgi:putative membrane protein